jgi:dihydrofolate reductase
MRQLIAFNHVSADGYFAASDGNLKWVVPDPALDRETTERLADRDAILFGRRTYEMFEKFWPTAVDAAATAPDPHQPGQRSKDVGAIGQWINDATKLVVSKTRKNATWTNSRILDGFNPEEIKRIKEGLGKDIMLFGSGMLTSALTRHRLIDEYQFVLSPVVLGKGHSLVTGVEDGPKLRLLDQQRYPSGIVMLRYALE